MLRTRLEVQLLVKILGSVLAHFRWEGEKVASFCFSHLPLLAKRDVGEVRDGEKKTDISRQDG